MLETFSASLYACLYVSVGLVSLSSEIQPRVTNRSSCVLAHDRTEENAPAFWETLTGSEY